MELNLFLNQIYSKQLADYQGSSFRCFTGKEKDSESGYYYFGARYFMPNLSIWNSVDPMADKYPSLSPYNYCAWNPMKMVDPDGSEVYVSGEYSNDVVERLQTKKMHIFIMKDGKLGVDIGKYRRSQLSKDEKMIYDAIKSENIHINIITGKASKTADINGYHSFLWEDGKKYGTQGGSFMGSSYYNMQVERHAETKGFIDVDLLDKNGYDQGVPHEISEQLLIGKYTIRHQRGVQMANKELPNNIFWKAHNKAIEQRIQGHYISLFGIEIPRSIHSDFKYTQSIVQ